MLSAVFRGEPGRPAWLLGLLLCTAAGCAAAPESTAAAEPDDSLPAIVLDRGPCTVQPEEQHSYTLPVWDLTVSHDHWDRLLVDVDADVQVPASVCVAGRPYTIELELQGSSTRKLPKKSFDLKFAKAQPLAVWPYTSPQPTAAAPIDRVLLKAMAKDQTLVREAVSFDMYRALGHAAPRTGFVDLRINGRYWGLYTVVEPVDDAFVSNLGLATPGRLYKGVRKYGSFADFAPGRDLTRAFELHLVDGQPLPAANDPETGELDDALKLAADTLGSVPAFEDLAQLVQLLQSTPLELAAFERDIDPVFPLAAYFDRMLWVALTQNGDAVAQNFYLYVTQSTGSASWTQLPWDSDISLGADWRDPASWMAADDALLLDGGNFFSQRLVSIPALRTRYRERFLEVLNGGTVARVGIEQLQRYRGLVAADLPLDAERWERTPAPADVFQQLEDFLSARTSALRDALEHF